MVPDLHGRLAGVGQGCPQKMSLLPVRPHRVHSETSCRCSCGADLLHSSCSAVRIRPHPGYSPALQAQHMLHIRALRRT